METRTPQEQTMLSSLKCKIPSKSLTLGTAVHSGAHTTVYIAKMRRPNGLQEEVAVKLVKEGAPPEYTLRLLEEAAILQELQHHHILPLVGIVDSVGRVSIVCGGWVCLCVCVFVCVCVCVCVCVRACV